MTNRDIKYVGASGAYIQLELLHSFTVMLLSIYIDFRTSIIACPSLYNYCSLLTAVVASLRLSLYLIMSDELKRRSIF